MRPTDLAFERNKNALGSFTTFCNFPIECEARWSILNVVNK